MTGDGKPEIVVTSGNTVTVLLNGGTGTFTVEPAITLAAAPGPVSVGDIHGDAKGDIYWFAASTVTSLINKGDGTFPTTPTVDSAFLGTVLAVDDLNGDNRMDVVTGSSTSVRVYRNKGDGTFGGSQYNVAATVAGLSLVRWSGGDPKDILALGPPNTVLINDGKGGFATQKSVSFPSAFPTTGGTAIADMDGDGRPDLVGITVQGTNNATNVWLNDVTNPFTTMATAAVAQYGVSVQVADLNGDGLLDMVTLSQPSSHTATLSVTLNTCAH